eukprot:TRINITY_DN595_c4_g2_i1.p1 TRINITY_DN595_c4_g2~~TRINITY_DN595_c4_g2_i1.p1  ORF type:complete len:320 (+),score=47.48 TRINITY_DN595_c4_g2_i1:63-962(+)
MSILVLSLAAVLTSIDPRFIKTCSTDSHCSVFGDSGATCGPSDLGRCVCSSGYSNAAYNSYLYYVCMPDGTSSVLNFQQKTNITVWMQHRDSQCVTDSYKSSETVYANAVKSIFVDPASIENYSATLYCLRSKRIGSVINVTTTVQTVFDKLPFLSTLVPDAIRNDVALTSVLGLSVDKMGASADPEVALCTETVELGSCCIPPQVEEGGRCLEPHEVWNSRVSTDDGSMHSGIIAAIVCSICFIIVLVVVVLCYRSSIPREGEFDTSVPQEVTKEHEASKSLKSVKSLKSMKKESQDA